MPLNIRLCFGNAENGSHSEQEVQRLCVGLGIIFGFRFSREFLSRAWLGEGHRTGHHDG